MYINFCALSDFHFDSDHDNNLFIFEKLDLLIKAIKGHFSFLKKSEKISLIVLVNGDIANKGSANEYLEATSFFKDFEKKLGKENFQVSFIFSPGNHDFNDNNRLKPFENFENFKMNFESKQFHISKDSFFELYKYKPFYGKKLNFIVLNPYTYCKSKNFSEVKIDSKYLENNLDISSKDINIVLSHVPDYCYDRKDKNNYEFLNSQSLLLYSHEHSNSEFKTISSVSETNNIITLNCFGEKQRKNESGFSIFTLNNEDCKMKATFFKYNCEEKIFHCTSQNFLKVSKTIQQYSALLPIVEAEYEYFMDGDFKFFSNNSNAKFKNLYIQQTFYKDNLCTDENEKTHNYTINDVLSSGNNILVFGEKESGKTTLAKKAFMEYYRKGFIPIYIAKKKIGEESVKQAIWLFLKKYYNKSKDYFQQNLSHIVLILDDFEMNDENVKFLEDNKLNIEKFFLIADHLEARKTDKLLEFEKFKLNKFGYANRYELITKWVDLEYSNLNNTERNILYKKIGDLFLKSKNNNIISNPKLLLILLYSYKEKESIIFDSSKIIYYEYIILKYLVELGKNTGIQETIIKDYYNELAYNKNKKKDKFSLSNFNENFCEEYSVTLKEIEKLNKETILFNGASNEFTYEFIYAYFLANYFIINSERLKEELLEIVHSQCFIPLYSSTILYFLHFTKNNSILQACIDMADKLFSNCKEINFEDDIKILNSFVEDVRTSTIVKEGEIKKNNLLAYKTIDKINESMNQIKETKQSPISKKEMELLLSYELDDIFSNYLHVVNKRKEKEEIVEKIYHMGLRRAGMCSIDVTMSFLQYLKAAIDENDKTKLSKLEFFFNFNISLLVSQIEIVGNNITILNDLDILKSIVEPEKTNARNLIYMKALLLLARNSSNLNVDYLVKYKNIFRKNENHICFGTLLTDIQYELNYVGAFDENLTRTLFQKVNSEVLSNKSNNAIIEMNNRKKRKDVLATRKFAPKNN